MENQLGSKEVTLNLVVFGKSILNLEFYIFVSSSNVLEKVMKCDIL